MQILRLKQSTFCALMLAFSASAFGSSLGLPSACLSYSIPGIGNQNYCEAAPGTYTVAADGGVFSSTVSAFPSPAVSVSATPSNPIEIADAFISYGIEFSGPTATVPIQVNAIASASGAASNAEFLIQDAQQDNTYLSLIASTDGGIVYGINGGPGPCSGNVLGQAVCGSSYVPGSSI